MKTIQFFGSKFCGLEWMLNSETYYYAVKTTAIKTVNSVLRTYCYWDQDTTVENMHFYFLSISDSQTKSECLSSTSSQVAADHHWSRQLTPHVTELTVFHRNM